MANARRKGALGEDKLVAFLYDKTGLLFERTPGSGSGKIKGDLYLPNKKNRFCIEVKNYKEDSLSSNILKNKTNNITVWWNKLLKDCKTKEPLLFYRWNRSCWYVVTKLKPIKSKNYLYISSINCYIIIAEHWLERENITW